MVQGLEFVRGKLLEDDTFIILTSTKAPESKSFGVELLKYVLREKRSPVIYVCIDRPFSSVKRLLDREEIDSSIAIFIDTVSLMSGTGVKEDRCCYLKHPENLTDMTLALSEAIGSLANYNAYVIFDSLSTLLIYNNINSMIKFIHTITAKVKQCEAKGFFIYSKRDYNDPFIDQIFNFFDKTIDLSGG